MTILARDLITILARDLITILAGDLMTFVEGRNSGKFHYVLVGEGNSGEFHDIDERTVDGGVMVASTVLQNKVELPVVLPEGGFIAPLAVIPFVAFCVMVRLQFSLKSKGTLGSLVATFGAVGIAAGILGLCAWNAASDVPVAGPPMAGLSPAATLFAIVHPSDMMLSTYNNSGGASARTALVIGCLLAAPAYAAFIYGIHASMVRNFDVTVRRLAGNK